MAQSTPADEPSPAADEEVDEGGLCFMMQAKLEAVRGSEEPNWGRHLHGDWGCDVGRIMYSHHHMPGRADTNVLDAILPPSGIFSGFIMLGGGVGGGFGNAIKEAMTLRFTRDATRVPSNPRV